MSLLAAAGVAAHLVLVVLRLAVVAVLVDIEHLRGHLAVERAQNHLFLSLLDLLIRSRSELVELV